jgi:hypothetical protein
VELAGAAGDEDAARSGAYTGVDVLGEQFPGQGAVRAERGDREELHAFELGELHLFLWEWDLALGGA